MASFLARESETRGEEDCFNSAPMLRGELGHGGLYTSAKTVRCSVPLHAGARHSPRKRRYPASSKTSRSVPCSAAVVRKSRTASSTACRAFSGVAPELETSNGMAWAMNCSPSLQIWTVYPSLMVLKPLFLFCNLPYRPNLFRGFLTTPRFGGS
jgi:hypothetical protein